MANALELYKSAKSRALVTTRTAKETLQRIDKEREQIQRDRDALSNQQVNLIFALDATASREQGWTVSRLIQDSMFSAAQQAGPNILVKLVSYSGLTQTGQLIGTDWTNNSFVLDRKMDEIRCVGGNTQIEKVFQLALSESCERRVHGLVLVGDSCEEDGAKLQRLAAELKKKDIKFFLFDDGERSTSRHHETFPIFRTITEAAAGAYEPFNLGSPDVLGDYLKAAVIFSTGNEMAIDMLPEMMDTPGGRKFVEKTRQLMLAAPGRK